MRTGEPESLSRPMRLRDQYILNVRILRQNLYSMLSFVCVWGEAFNSRGSTAALLWYQWWLVGLGFAV